MTPHIAHLIQQLSIMALPVLLAITLHEAAHGWVADKKGDSTARFLGRLTLNPLAHIDLVGTILVPILLFVTSGFLFGYAKPVPVNFYNLRRPKHDMAWVAGAGPATNLVLAVISAILFRLLVFFHPMLLLSTRQGGSFVPTGDLSTSFLFPLLLMLEFSVNVNVLLCIFNLLPIPPLDGGRVAVGLLPQKQSAALSSVEPYGMFIVILLLFLDPQLGILRTLVWPFVALLTNYLLGLL